MISAALLMTLLTGAVATDLRRYKIYNLWVLPGLIAGLVISACTGGGTGFLKGVSCAALAFAVLFPVYLAGGIGAGDVKLFAAVATWLTPGEVLMCIFVSFLLGGAYGIFRILRERKRHLTIRFAVPILVSVLFIFGGKL
ncbi:MAG: prepilin peptidase [Lachnospiraceae bacterium]|nr:prepilin peptidase [Lachnospiraceae bacterium]